MVVAVAEVAAVECEWGVAVAGRVPVLGAGAVHALTSVAVAAAAAFPISAEGEDLVPISVGAAESIGPILEAGISAEGISAVGPLETTARRSAIRSVVEARGPISAMEILAVVTLAVEMRESAIVPTLAAVISLPVRIDPGAVIRFVQEAPDHVRGETLRMAILTTTTSTREISTRTTSITTTLTLPQIVPSTTTGSMGIGTGTGTVPVAGVTGTDGQTGMHTAI